MRDFGRNQIRPMVGRSSPCWLFSHLRWTSKISLHPGKVCSKRQWCAFGTLGAKSISCLAKVTSHLSIRKDSTLQTHWRWSTEAPLAWVQLFRAPWRKPGIPKQVPMLLVRTPTAHWRVSHSTPFQFETSETRPSVFWVVGKLRKPNKMMVYHLWTFTLFSRNICQLHASLKVLGLREQFPFNKGLVTMLHFLNIFSLQETVFIVFVTNKNLFNFLIRRPSEGPCGGSSLTEKWRQRKKPFPCVFPAVWETR